MTRSDENEDETMNEDIEIIDDDRDSKDESSKATGGSDDLKTQVEELKKEKLYLLADFDNYRKQTIKERSDLIKYGSESIIRELLTVLDNLERAAASEITPETMITYKNGVEMIVTQFKKALEKFGVEEMDPKGQSFDPLIHEAVSSENNPDLPPNSVSQVLKKAYKLKGKLIRPAQVVVNTASTNKNEKG